MQNTKIDDDYDILDEYVDITNKINEICGIIEKYRYKMKKKLERANTHKKKEELLKEFHEKMLEIQNSDMITRNYRQLKKRQQEIRIILLPPDKMSNTKNTSDVSTTDENIDISITSILGKVKSRIN